MTIHHDKLVYGRLASSREDLSEEKLAEMLKKMNRDESETEEKSSGKDDADRAGNERDR